jgi:hypothetical protein
MSEPAHSDDDPLVAPQVHEFNANLLFSGEQLDNPMQPYFALVAAYDHADGELCPQVDEFDAVDTTWRLDRATDYDDQPDHGTARHWQGKIQTRDGDAGDAYLEYQLPVYDTTDPLKNRRINFQFRPALPDARHTDTDTPIGSLPDDLSHGIRIRVSSANVEPHTILAVLQALADELGVKPSLWGRRVLHEWSRITGLAYYLRLEQAVADELIIGANGILERLSVFASRRDGHGELTWDNGETTGKRTAVTLDPTGLDALEHTHATGKLLKSYLMREAHNRGEPTDHPKIEVQWNRSLTPDDVTVAWSHDTHPDDPDADETIITRDQLRQELHDHLLNALTWAGLDLDPTNPAFVPDDHFSPSHLDDATHDALDLRPDPIEDAIEREHDLTSDTLLRDPPTDSEADVLQTLSDGGHYDTLEEIGADADVSTSTVSRTHRKYDRLLSKLTGYQAASDVVRTRLTELLATLERDIDNVTRQLGHLSSQLDSIDDNTPFARWARRWGARIQDLGDELRLRLDTGRLTTYELTKILRAGYQAADHTDHIDPRRFADATLTYHNDDGDVVDGHTVAVWQGGRLKIAGRHPVDT